MDLTQSLVTIVCMAIYAYVWYKLGFYRGWILRSEIKEAIGRFGR